MDQLVYHPLSQRLPVLKENGRMLVGRQTTSCPKATKEDQLKCRNAVNEGKLKKQGKRQHDEAIRSEVRLDSNESLEDDEVHDHSMKEPNVFGPMDNFANIVNPERSLKKKVKGGHMSPRFGKELAISACEVNNEKYDPANWWGTFGGVTANLKKVAMMILSLTSSSSGCERNWSTFEGIHTKKRNKLEASKLNNLVYVQFNYNLTEKAKRRKVRDVEVLLSNDGNMAQEWIVECDGDENRNRDEEVEVQDQQDQEAQWEVIGEAMEADEYLQPRQSSRTTTKTTQREPFDEEFKSGSEEVVYEEGDYESDGVKIIECCGDED
ncbi:tRNA dimethylallyltransferase 2 isoform X1 [Tanacetum coccineum]